MRIHWFMLTLLVGASFSLSLQAEEGEKPNRKDAKAKFMEQFDENKDGKIDEAERAKVKAAKAATKPAKAEPKINTKRDELLKKFDANGDGKLDADERNQARLDAAKERPADAPMGGGFNGGAGNVGGGGNGPNREAMMRQFDANGDGVLDAAEMAKLKGAMAGNRPDGMMKQFDSNGDGQLDAAEKNRMRDAMQGGQGRSGGLMPGGAQGGPRPGGAGKGGPRPGGKK